jgi:hypothetical protein
MVFVHSTEKSEPADSSVCAAAAGFRSSRAGGCSVHMLLCITEVVVSSQKIYGKYDPHVAVRCFSRWFVAEDRDVNHRAVVVR